ncbi:MAG: DUF6320 domain-containing protein [Christensenellaceae bacterium]
MNRCEYCNVKVDENLQRCPLCHRVLNEGACENTYPQYDHSEKPNKKSYTAYKVGSALLIFIGVCALINLLTIRYTRNLWFLTVAAPIVYMWVLVQNTIKSKIFGGLKVLFQVFMMSLMLFVFDLNAGFKHWSVNYVIPFVIIAHIFLITYLVFTKKLMWNEYVMYIFAVIILGGAPMTLYSTGVSTQLIVSAITALYATLTFVGMMIFAEKSYKKDLLRRFRF